MRKLDVLIVGSGVDDGLENLIESAGGNMNLKVVKTIDHLIMEYLLLLEAYDLIILMVTVEDAIKVTRELREDYYVKSMIVGVTSEEDTDEERSELIMAGANECEAMPLTNEKMESVFNKLRAGIESRTYRKQFFKALIIDDNVDAAFRSHHEKLIREAGGLVSMSTCTLTKVQLGISYDLIIMTKPNKLKELRDNGLWSTMVGVTSSLEEFTAFTEAGVTNMFAEPLTMAKLLPLI